jgi:hypothetical protein
MHKKKIKGRFYFYTNYRDKEGRIITKYLGSNEEEARLKELTYKKRNLHSIHWNYLVLAISVSILLFFFKSNITGYYVVEGGGSAPTITDVNIFNDTSIYFNNSIIGYGNYSDVDGDDSGGSSYYNWIIEGIVNKSGTTGQLLLCHFDYVHNCSDNESAFTNNILDKFNDSSTEKNISFTEKNSTLIYFKVLKETKILSAILNITGERYGSGNNELIYSSLKNESKSDGAVDTNGGAMAGVSSNTGINSWIMMDSPPSGTSNMLEIRYGEAYNNPTNGNFSYDLKICQVSGITELSETTDPDGNCTGSYITVKHNFNLSSVFTDTSNATINLSFDDNVSYTFSSNNDYLIKFEYLSGDTSTNRFWRFYYDDNPQILSYISWENPLYTFGKGLPNFNFYMTSNYSDYVTLNIGNDDDIEFNSSVRKFDTKNTTSDFFSEVQDYLDSCIQGSNGYCDVPLNISADSSGKIVLNSLEINYPHLEDGKFGKGAPFNESFTLNYNSTNNFNSSIGTIEMWIFPWWDGNNNSEHYLFDEKGLGDGNRVYIKKNSTHLIFGVDDKLNSSNIVSYNISSWQNRSWYLIAVTWDLNNGSLNLYTDGILRESLNSNTIDVNNTGEFIYVGSRNDNTSQAKAVIDELRISEHKKSSDELVYYHSLNKSYFDNSVYLNLSSENIIRNFEIKFQLTPCDTSQNGSAQNSSILVVENFIPSSDILWIYPDNNSYISNLTNSFVFNWSASSDDDNDTIYYYLEIDDNPDFSSPEYTNKTIDINYTYIIGGLHESNYSLRILATDNIINSSWSPILNVVVDYSAPNLTIIEPSNNSISYSKNINFVYNISDFNGLNKCSIQLDNIINQTNDSIVSRNNRFYIVLEPTKHNWNITCWDNALNTNSSINSINVFSADEFNISNLNLSTNLESFSRFYIENDYGKINFSDSVNLSYGLDLNRFVNISYNRIEIMSGNISKLNKSADLTLKNLNFINPMVLRDGVECSNVTCAEISYNSTTNDFVFNVTGFTVYSAAETPVTPTPLDLSGPGGGGGGGGGLRKISSFEVSDTKIKSVVKEYSIRKDSINITNTGQTSLIIEVSHNLPNIIILDRKLYVIKPGQTETVFFDITGSSPGIWGGKLFFKTNNIQKVVPIIIEVETTKVLFDAKIDITSDYENIYEGEDLTTQITLFNVGKPKKIDVTIIYLIKDFEGNKIHEESETFAVDSQKSFTKVFKTKNLAPGSYIAGINLLYEGEVATSSSTFNILSRSPKIEEKSFFEKNKHYIIITIIIFILIMLIVIERMNLKKLIRVRKRLLKLYEKK